MKSISKKLITFQFIILFISSLQAQTLHSIIFADTYANDIQESCKSDMDAMMVEMASIANFIGFKKKNYFKSDYDFKDVNLRNVINNLEVTKDIDIVFFYYTGHGAHALNDASKWPQMSLYNKNMIVTNQSHVSMNEVINSLNNKKPRLLIVMVDCCNNFSPHLTPKGINKGNTVIKGLETIEHPYIDLFRNLKGSIIVCSSKSGQNSVATKGGSIFTFNFLSELGKIVSGNAQPQWENLLSQVRSNTLKDGNHEPEFEIKIINQTSPPPPHPRGHIAKLLSITNKNFTPQQRIDMIPQIKDAVFESDNSTILVVGKNGNTILESENAIEFVKRLSISQNLIDLIEVNSIINNQGKVIELKIHEIYKFN